VTSRECASRVAQFVRVDFADERPTVAATAARAQHQPHDVRQHPLASARRGEMTIEDGRVAVNDGCQAPAVTA
jgi:hypothetical protein